MYKTFGEILKEKLIHSQMLSADHFQGCNAEEVANIIAAQKVKRLPKVFKEYLATMGKTGFGNIAFVGSSWICAELPHLKNALLSEIEEFKYDFRLPEDAFVFFCHGGVEYHYFLTSNENNDPPVFLYKSEDKTARQIDEHLSEYFLRLFSAYQRIMEKSPKTSS